MNSHDFDNIIKQKAQQRAADVPGDIWENISKEKKKRRFPFLWWIFLALFLAGGTMLWNMQDKSQPAYAVKVEKDNNDKKRTLQKETEHIIPGNLNDTDEKNSTDNSNKTTTKSNKRSTVDLAEHENISNLKDKTLPGKNNSTHSINLTKASVPAKKIMNMNNGGQHVDIFNSNNKPLKNSSVLNNTKNQPTGKEELFSPNRNKKKTKGNSRINVTNGEIESLVDKAKVNSGDTGNKVEILQSAPIVNKEDLTVKPDSIEIALAAKNNIDSETVVPGNDSLTVKKTVPSISHSSAKKSISVYKKSAEKKKRPGLKIEAGITAVSPIQQYEQPLYVTRILDKPNVHTEFISDNIKTKVEPGMGFAVSLVKDINKKWSIGTGLRYLRFTEQLKLSGIQTNTSYTLVQRLVTNPNGSFLKTDTVSAITKDNSTLNGRNIYNNLSIPLFARYKIISGKKLSFSFTTGVYINLLRKYTNNIPGQFETSYAGGKKQTDVKNSAGLDLFAGLHFSGSIHKKYEWFAETIFDYNLTSYKTSSLSFNKKIHQPGISLGISYKLGRFINR